jgi:hypothetical protein
MLLAPVRLRPGGRVDVAQPLPGRIATQHKANADESTNDNDNPDEGQCRRSRCLSLRNPSTGTAGGEVGRRLNFVHVGR